MLEPLLQHNRDAFDRFVVRQKQVLIGAALCGTMFALFMPAEWILLALMLLLVVFAAVFFVLEIGKVRVFRRDLREQRKP